MKRFLSDFLLFSLLLLIVLEFVIRVFHLTIDVPQREIDKNGIQRYVPDQIGLWSGGTHYWHINKMGWPGRLPEFFKNLIIVIGDSHIENLMNSDEYHQNVLLKKNLPDYNFMEAARAGVSFIEALEISKSLDSLNPMYYLIYLKNSDFVESIYELGSKDDITQLSVKTNKIIPGKIKYPLLKKVLYSSKLLYFIYNKVLIKLERNSKTKVNDNKKNIEIAYEKDLTKYRSMFSFCKNKYDLSKMVFVFHPGTDSIFINLSRELGLKTITFDKEFSYKWRWTKTDDSHWSAKGHKEAAGIIADSLKIYFNSNENSHP